VEAGAADSVIVVIVIVPFAVIAAIAVVVAVLAAVALFVCIAASRVLRQQEARDEAAARGRGNQPPSNECQGEAGSLYEASGAGTTDCAGC
jgi:hypothetical protein